MTESADPRTAFIEAATWHGPLAPAQAILAAHPDLARNDIHIAAILGDDAEVRRLLALNPAGATARIPPYGGDALNYLGLSKYLRLDPARTAGFLRAATALLDAGADPNTGFWTPEPHPEFETALYGAAGVAHNAELTWLLVQRGADPTDGEAVYHSPEGDDLGAMQVLVETGRMRPEDLALMLVRKHDWHDYPGVKYLLEHGADPNYQRKQGWIAIHHGIARDNDLDIIELLLDHQADPTLRKDGQSAIQLAARRGRGDLLALFEKRGFSVDLDGVDRLIAACARNNSDLVKSIAQGEPAMVRELMAQGGARLAEFAATWNTDGVGLLLDLGVPITALYEGDGYHDIAKDSMALHVAAWKGVASTVKLLIARGTPVNAPDGKGRTPLMLAVKATLDSYWIHRRTPEAVRSLLEAGASREGVRYPTGYADIDVLLQSS